MKTRASIMGHPVHMGLAHFPVAFLIGAFAFDVAARVLGNAELFSVAAYLLVAGVATGVLTAVPGLVDFLTTVPTAARSNATRHLVVSTLALLTFGAAWFIRGGIPGELGAPGLILEAMGALLIGLAGFLGGSLVLKDLIGPIHDSGPVLTRPTWGAPEEVLDDMEDAAARRNDVSAARRSRSGPCGQTPGHSSWLERCWRSFRRRSSRS